MLEAGRRAPAAKVMKEDSRVFEACGDDVGREPLDAADERMGGIHSSVHDGFACEHIAREWLLGQSPVTPEALESVKAVGCADGEDRLASLWAGSGAP